MNTERLLELIETLLDDESETRIDKHLSLLQSALNELSAAPSDASKQSAVAERRQEFEDAVSHLQSIYDPVFLDKLDDLGVRPYFTLAMVNRIQQSISENSMTPIVVQNEVETIRNERNAVLGHLNAAKGSLMGLGFNRGSLEPGEAEVGFQIPRIIFDNELGGLARELSDLRLIIRAFSELSGNPGEQIEVRQISTTDPIFFFALALGTISYIGRGVGFCLDQWKKVEEIRLLRAQTANLQAGPKGEQLVAHFDEMIDEKIKSEVRKEAERLVGPGDGSAGRRNELINHVELALSGLLARIERGMVVELRLGPPVPVPDGDGDAAAIQEAFVEIERIRDQLAFPQPSNEPLLKLTRMKPDGEAAPSAAPEN